MDGTKRSKCLKIQEDGDTKTVFLPGRVFKHSLRFGEVMEAFQEWEDLAAVFLIIPMDVRRLCIGQCTNQTIWYNFLSHHKTQ